jgi:hypothetical protein
MFGVLVTQAHAAVRPPSRAGLPAEERPLRRSSLWAIPSRLARALQILAWLSVVAATFKGQV